MSDMKFTPDELLNAATVLVLVGLVVIGYLHYRLEQRKNGNRQADSGTLDEG